MAPSLPDEVFFDGSNWDDLDRLITVAKFLVLLDKDLDGDSAEVPLISTGLRGAALDWLIANSTASPPKDVSTTAKLKNQLEAAFGITTGLRTTRYRQQLAELKFDHLDLSTFFADFNRLTQQLGMIGDSSRIMALNEKLPPSIKVDMAKLGLAGMTYDTARDRIMAMGLQGAFGTVAKANRPKCQNCGKRGHKTTDCRNPKKKD